MSNTDPTSHVAADLHARDGVVDLINRPVRALEELLVEPKHALDLSSGPAKLGVTGHRICNMKFPKS